MGSAQTRRAEPFWRKEFGLQNIGITRTCLSVEWID